VDRTRKNACRGSDGRRASSFFGLSTASKTIYELIGLEGIGYWIEMQVDTQAVHVSADIPVLGRLLGGSVIARLKEIVQRTFQHKLPEGHGKA